MNMFTKTFSIGALGALLAAPSFAASIEGKWRTIDDETKKPKAVVQISQSGSTFNGTIVALADGVENRCPACQGDKPLIGMKVLTGLKEKDGKYADGKIFDPKSGKTYSAKAELANGGNSLKVRGFLGVSLLGRTQTWQRVQ
ncbi:MAG: DUF2147 domain-containing protein [Neisseria sp.]|nr:DUF2147 domain-containing protein [Neisseria sp.]